MTGDWISEGEAWEARQAKGRAELEAKVKPEATAETETSGDVGENGFLLMQSRGTERRRVHR